MAEPADAFKYQKCSTGTTKPPIHRYNNENRPYLDAKNVNFPVELIARSRAQGFTTIFMDSMAVPNILIKKLSTDERIRQRLLSYAKWRIDFVQDLPVALSERQLAMTSVLEKIINRGRITRLSQELEEIILYKLFPPEPYSVRSATESYEHYHEPNLPNEWHDGKKYAELDGMTAEEYFYKKVFIATVGIEHAKDILPQVHFSSLAINGESIDSAILSQRIDFLITNQQKSIAVEIDDATHASHSAKDLERDRILQSNGLKVYRITISDLINDGRSLQELRLKLKELYSGSSVGDSANQSLIAVKLAHQFQLILIELLKNGKILPGRRCKIYFDPANIPKLSHSSQEKVLSAALSDLRNLSEHVASLYSSRDKFFANIELVQKDPDLVISVNDNYDFPQAKIVYIQDIAFPFALEQNKFAKLTKCDMVANESSLSFILNYIFRFRNFNPNQIDGIIQAISGKDSIVLLPTGSGKSVVYQLLSFVMAGPILVVDPITSLIEDQVDNLTRRGIDRAIGITASTKNKEQVQSAIETGQYNLIFISPERLQIEAFRHSLKNYCTRGIIPVCAIDEAHCVSEWGHDFRTSYLNLANICRQVLKTKSGLPVILALTGTASDVVLRDMERDLGIDEENVIRPSSFDRKEIEFIVIPAPSKQKDIALQRILEEELPQKFGMSPRDFYAPNGEKTMSGIVFCPHVNGRYGVLEVVNEISSMGIDAKEYAGQKPRNFPVNGEEWSIHKTNVAKQFKDNNFPLLAATKSFGMGIDKPNIRYTVHYSLPQSIESYYQEAGRAGRDHQRAYSYVILSNDYPEHNRRLLSQSSNLASMSDSMKTHGYNGDDVDRMLYFHTKTFGGIESELQVTKKVLAQLGDLSEAKDLTIASFDDNRESTEKIIYRLSILGIVKDYTINHSANEFNLILNQFNREEIIKNYGRYVRTYQDAEQYAEKAEEVLRRIDDIAPQDFILNTIEIMLRDFIYSTIESSRRRALSNLLEIMTIALQENGEKARSDRIRKEILRSLGSNYADIIKDITDNPENLAQISAIVKKLSQKRRRDLYAEVGRALESYPQHPGLLLAHLQIKLTSEDFDVAESADAFADVINFGEEQYGISAEAIASAIHQSLSFISQAQQPKYAEIINLLMQNSHIDRLVKHSLVEKLSPAHQTIATLSLINIAFEPLKNKLGKDVIWKTQK